MSISYKTLFGLTLLLLSSASFAGPNKAPTTYQAETMISVQTDAAGVPGADFGQPKGAAWLIRSRNALHGRVMVNVGAAGTPHTVWWVVFNHPEKCIYTPCTVGPNPLDDLLNPAVGVSIFSASGALSAHNGSVEGDLGVVNVDIKTVGGRYPDGLFVLDFLGEPFGNSLNRGNGFGAEVHLVVDVHPDFDPADPASWRKELTETQFAPGLNHRAVVFLPKGPG